jgi:opacity protein-like surface antigen
MPTGNENYATATERSISGVGIQAGFGIVVRPIEDSPFRFGLSVVTPTYYESLKARTTHELYCDGKVYFDDYAQSARLDNYEFNLKTPWRFNLSLGHTFANRLAVGAEYEYANFAKNKISYGDSWDGYGDTDPDDALNWNNEDVLKSVHTFKLGAELSLLPEMKVRVGYNYVSGSTYKDSYLNTDTQSELYRYCYPETDFTNLSAINRLTCGIGFAFDRLYLDMAYQYQHQTGKFYAYDDQYASSGSKYVSYLSPKSVDLSKHTFQVTLGYRF